MGHDLDAVVARLQRLPEFTLDAIDGEGNVNPWYAVKGSIVVDVVIKETVLAQEVLSVSGQITHWGRLAAQAKRVWEIREREYRTWRDGFILRLLEEADKKPTQAVIEATYRTDPAYAVWYGATEKAEEAYNSCVAILDGFKAKRDMLKAFAGRVGENTEPQLIV